MCLVKTKLARVPMTYHDMCQDRSVQEEKRQGRQNLSLGSSTPSRRSPARRNTRKHIKQAWAKAVVDKLCHYEVHPMSTKSFIAIAYK